MLSEQPFIAALVAAGRLSAGDVDRVERLAAGNGQERVQDILTKLGLISEHDLAAAMAAHLGLELAAADEFPAAPVLAEAISRKFLKQHRVIPLREAPEGLVVASADPLDGFAVAALGHLAKKPVVARVATPAEIEAAFQRLYGEGKPAAEQMLDAAAADQAEGASEDVERLKDLASEAPVIRLVNHWIARAVEERASDIHIEASERALKVRYRIDGVLREVEAPPPRLRAAVISRVKIMAKLDIAERRLAQDGRIKLAVRGKDIDIRVSTVPTLHGESVVMRLLDRGGLALDFASLGFDPDLLATYLDLLRRPHGILLVTGPTGSGKTTTLYASLLTLHAPGVKILTVEDPVEYQLEGINQAQVKPQIGASFASTLRSFLRQDPDIIMIGEIRDGETARIAVQAALTGHLVLSTLHTNDAPSAITRLLDMGIEDYLLTSTIIGVAAQRLVRRLCEGCKQPYELLPEIATRMQVPRLADGGPVTLWKAIGCPACGGTGYHGRTTILELFVMTDAIRRAISSRAHAPDIQRLAIEQSMRTMYQHGVAKALAGVTSIDEVLRMTREG